MQPYFLPYIGYWQLLSAVDQFVLYDNIQYTKKGWINRNRFLRHGADAFVTLPLKKASDYLNVDERSLADTYTPKDLLQPLAAAYQKAPFFEAVYPLLEKIFEAAPRNLFEFIHHSIVAVAHHLEIRTPIVLSSTVPIDHGLKSEAKVLALCRALAADRYLNPIGGRELYAAATFAAAGVELKFIQARPITYPQFGGPFVPALSILDVMMFNSRDAVQQMLGQYDVV